MDGWRLLVERGDGLAALDKFKSAAELASDQPQVWFVLGMFYYHFGALFDQSISEADVAFNRVRDLVPNFAPAIAHLVSLAHLKGDQKLTAQLIHEYEALGSTSVVAEVIGIVDTLLLGSPAAQLKLLNTDGGHSFLALEHLVFQAGQVGTEAERRGPARRILVALARRAATDSQHVLALRMGVAADLHEGWADSARARLNSAGASKPTARERDMWILLARATGLPPLGDWQPAADRIAAAAGARAEGYPLAHWLLARLGRDQGRHTEALRRLATRDSAPLAASLSLDLEARRVLEARHDTARALELWDAATRRYAVLSVGFDLAASLWPLRLEMARVAVRHHDDTATARACGTFETLMGAVDQVALPEIGRLCARGRPSPTKPRHDSAG